MKRPGSLTAAVFLLLLAGLFAYSVPRLPDIAVSVQSSAAEAAPGAELSAAAAETESALSDALDRQHLFIQAYGGFQRLLGKRLVEDSQAAYNVAKLDDGALNFVSDSAVKADVSPQAQALDALSQTLAADGIPVLYVQAPQKISRSGGLPEGLSDYGNEEADQLLSFLTRTDTLDLRDVFEAQPDYSALFFRTDHHWRPEGALLALQTLQGVLEQDYGVSLDPAFFDPASYTVETLPDFFLGSQGKRVGTLYAGTDDFPVFTPNFPTSFTFDVPAWNVHRSGDWNASVCFPERVAQKDYFGGNPYTYYAGGDYPLTTIVNQAAPEGPHLLLVRDSFSCALTPFLAAACGRLDLIDLRYFDGSVAQYAQETDPDLVLVMYTCGTVRKDEFFQFQ